MSADAYAEHWLEGYRLRHKGSSYDTAESALRGFARDWRGIRLDRIEPVQAEKWARDNRWRVPIVITMMNAAVKDEVCERNPFAGLSHKGPGRRDLQPLTEPEVAQLAAGAERLYGSGIASFVTFAAYTGLRVGEIFELRWPDVDFTANRIRVARRVYRGAVDLPKGNRPRQAVLTPPATEALLALDRQSETVFTGNRGGRLSQSGLAYYWRGIEGAFGRHVTPHELRHFAGHFLYVRMGLADYVVAEQLGHRDGGKLIRQLYGHGDVGALETIDRAFGENVVPLREAR